MLPLFKSRGEPSTKVSSKRQEKKHINIRSHSGLYFQVGLVVSMLVMLLILETDWKLDGSMAYTPPRELSLTEFDMKNYVVEKPVVHVAEPEPEPVKRNPVKAVNPTAFTPVKNNTDYIETRVKANDGPVENPPVGTLTKKDEPTVPTSMELVEWVPTYPGCEDLTTNDARMKCLSDKIRKHIMRKFDVDRFADLYDAGTPYRIYAQFTIGADGAITDIKTRAPGDDLAKEAESVISKLPIMDPGRMQDKQVAVMYRIPIILQFSD